jgi:hypothetical protein
MHKGFFRTVLMATALFVLSTAASAEELPKTYGKGISGSDTTLVSRILATPGAFVGKPVCVEGTVVGVCARRGCWMEIASDKETETIRVKVTDGQIVFPMALMGERVRVEGVFAANKLDLDTTKRICEGQAKEAGKEFNPASVTECMTLYQISGTGAVLLEHAAAVAPADPGSAPQPRAESKDEPDDAPKVTSGK